MADAPVSPLLRHVALTRILAERLNGTDSHILEGYLARMRREKNDPELPSAHYDSAM